MVHRLSAWIVALAIALAGTSVHAVEVEAGPIWNNMEAQGKCPQVCAQAGGQWSGQWRTTDPGRMSVCDCARTGPTVLPYVPPPQAGPIVRYEETDFMGNDIGMRASSSSFDRCAADCLADSKCVAFTYSRPGTCGKKSGVGIMSNSMFATSGFVSSRGTPPPMPAYLAPPAPQNPPAVATPNACSVGGTPKCPGCSVSCNPADRPECTPPVDGPTMFCQRDASCRCVSP